MAYKAEVIHRRAVELFKQAVELANAEWVAWFQPPPADGAAGLHPTGRFEANHRRQRRSGGRDRLTLNQTGLRDTRAIHLPEGARERFRRISPDWGPPQRRQGRSLLDVDWPLLNRK